jgi:ribonuclease Z
LAEKVFIRISGKVGYLRKSDRSCQRGKEIFSTGDLLCPSEYVFKKPFRMTSISFFGTGSGLPSADRFFSSTLLSVGGMLYLVDVGEPCVHLLRDRGTLICDLDAVLVTHGHVDHLGGLPSLLQGAMLLGRSKPLSIYLPEEMILPLRAWISALYLTEEGLGFSLNWVAWSDLLHVDLEGGNTVTPYPNTHLQNCYRRLPGADPARPCQSFSLEIARGDFRVLFSGDLSSASEITTILGQPLEALVCELSHFGVDELVAALDGARIGSLCLVHLSEDLAGNVESLKSKLEELLPNVGDIIIPEDGESIDF